MPRGAAVINTTGANLGPDAAATPSWWAFQLAPMSGPGWLQGFVARPVPMPLWHRLKRPPTKGVLFTHVVVNPEDPDMGRGVAATQCTYSPDKNGEVTSEAVGTETHGILWVRVTRDKREKLIDVPINPAGWRALVFFLTAYEGEPDHG